MQLKCAFLICLFLNALGAAGQPVSLRCEYLSNPLGIDNPRPSLSWEYSAAERNFIQHSYEIIVGTSVAEIEHGSGTAWSSGRIESGESTGVVYDGAPLKPFNRYYWRVRTWASADAVPRWSETAWFETSMLEPNDWKASWIGDGSKQFERDEDFYQNDRMPLFKKTINVNKKVATARLYVSGLGYHYIHLNGKQVGGNVLDPGWTNYSKEVLYATHDITASVEPGMNVVSVMLGNGWYNPLPMRLFGRFNLRDVQETGRPCLKAEIHITYTDATREKIVTDNSWLTAPGPVIRNNVYLGEWYDARFEQPDFYSVRSGKQWQNAIAVSGPTGRLYAQLQPPVLVMEQVKPVSVLRTKPGVYIADMGKNFAGVVRIRVKGKAGTEVRLKSGENIHADGSLNYFTSMAGHIKSIWNLRGGPGAPADAWQEDRYILKGTGVEEWAPRFTFHGFRYVEITGWPGTPDVNSITGLRMHSALVPNGDFTCSNEMFNKLHEVAKRTFLSNVFSVQSDCPAREKMGYGADIVVTANSFIYNFDMHNFYRKTVRDYANDQQPDGGITEIAPYTGIADRGYGGHSGPLGWQLAFPYVQKQLYEFYRDRRIVEEHYPAFKNQMDFLESHAVNGLYHWDISDHVAIDPRPEAFTAACFYYHHALLAKEFATILRIAEDEERYAKLSEQIKKDIVSKYYVPGTGRFDNATQSAQAFALYYKLSPEPEKTLQVFLDELKRHKMHVSSGIFGVMMMFDLLREFDLNEVAYTVANQRDFPGWGYMLSKGATTLWESWEYPENASSQNHPMFGSTEEWFYRTILGINPAAPGFSKIVVKPQPAADLTFARGYYHSIKGHVSVDWNMTGGKFTLNVSIPGNTTAEVWVRSRKGGTVLESEKPATVLRYENGYAVVKVGSGAYTFSSE
jgi:alpha-L-rhamnosidase